MPCSSESTIILWVASAARAHVVRTAVLRVRLAGRDVVHVARVVLGAGTDSSLLSIEGKLSPYLQYLGDSGRVWTLPYINKVVVRHLPEDEEY